MTNWRIARHPVPIRTDWGRLTKEVARRSAFVRRLFAGHVYVRASGFLRTARAKAYNRRRSLNTQECCAVLLDEIAAARNIRRPR